LSQLPVLVISRRQQVVLVVYQYKHRCCARPAMHC
jgi:hypothetical protein